MKESSKIDSADQKPMESGLIAEKDATIARLQQDNRRLALMNESSSTRVKSLQRVMERYAAANLTLTETMGDLRNENHRIADENGQLRRQLAEREARLSELMQELNRKPKE